MKVLLLILSLIFAVFPSIVFADEPGGVSSGLELWLKADVGIDEDDGEGVDEWSDQSGNGNHATQTTASNRPTYEDDAVSSINHNPVLDFDGSDDSFTISDITALKSGSDYTLYTVGIREDSGANFVIGAEDNTTNENLSLGYSDTNKVELNQGGNSLTVDVDAFATAVSTPFIIFGEFDGTGHRVWELHEADKTEDTNSDTAGLGGAKDTYIGLMASSSDYYNGRIAEVIIYSDDLTNGEAAQVESYLALKYGLTLDQSSATDYVDSDGDTIWDASTNSSYDNDIAGIGQDDGSGLDQASSTAESDDAIVTIGSASSQGDGDWLIWGNNDAATSSDTTDIPAGTNLRLDREWYLQETGDIGTVSVRFNLDNTGLPRSGDPADYVILRDTDGTFNNATVLATGDRFGETDTASSTVLFEAVDFSDGDYFTIAMAHNDYASLGGIFDGLKLWLDADDISTLHTNTTCSGGSPEGGDEVECWEDKSGENANVTKIPGDCNESDSGTQTCGVPQYRTNQFHGRAALEFFRGQKDSLRYDLDANGVEWTGTNFTQFIVFEQQGDPSQYDSFFSNGNPPGSDHYQIDNNSDDEFRLFVGSGDGSQSAIFEEFDNNLKLYIINANASGFTTLVDGEAASSISSGNGRIFEHYRINQNRNGKRLNDAKIAEVIIYDRSLSLCEMWSVDRYLGDKYGLNFGGGSPGAVSCENILVWYNAGRGVHTSSGKVTDWDDLGPNDENADQSTGSERPGYIDDGLNGNPVVRFDGSNDVLETNLDFGADEHSELSIYSVYKPDVDGAGSPWGNSDGNWDRYIVDNSSLNNAVSTGPGGSPANNLDDVDGLFTANFPTLSCAVFDEDNTNASHIQVNGGMPEHFTAGHDPQSDNDFKIGSDGNTNYFDGDIAEIIAYDNVHNSTERRQIETYLAIKYGVTLDDNQDYLDSSGKTLFDSDGTHSGYTNDIAGIGHDDHQSLNQLTSISSNGDAIIEVSGATSQDHGDFLLWGNDNGTTSEVTTNLPPGTDKRLGRIWRFQEAGNMGTVKIEFHLADLSVTGSDSSDFALITDGDSDFTDGAVTTLANSFSDDTVSFIAVDIPDNSYVSLGTSVSSTTPANSSAPGGISDNLQVWLKADQGVAGSAMVTDWADQSPHNNNFAESTASRQPALTTDAMNFNPALTFDGSNDRLEDSDGEDYINNNDAISTFVAVDSDETATDRYIFLTNDDNEAPWSLRFDAFGVTSRHNRTLKTGLNTGGDNRSYEADDADLTKNTPQVLGVSWSSGHAPNFYVEGRAIDSDPTTVQGGTLANADYLRVGAGGNKPFWEGHIGEVVVYDAELPENDRNKVESYLALKYGVTLDQSPAQSYTASDGTEMWDKDATGASTHNNNIAGIGRDDDSELGQVKSKSQTGDSILTIEAVGEGTNATPNFTDIDDLEFLTWGNNDGDIAQVATNLPPDLDGRLERIWQVQEVGELGSTSLTFDLSALAFGDVSADDFVLIIDSNADFTSGAVTQTADSYVSNTNLVTFNAVDFSDGDYFSLGIDTLTLAPGGVATDLQVWLRADADVTGGNSISDWEDQSPNGNDFSQNTATEQPALTTNAMNFNPAVTFDGSDDHLEDSDADDYLEGLEAISTFVAVDADSANSDRFIFLTTDDNSEIEAPWSLRFDSSGSISGRSRTLKTGLNSGDGDVLYEADESNLAKDIPQVLGASWSDGNAPSFYVEGRAIASDPTDTQDGELNDVDFISLGNGNHLWKGHMAEVIFYGAELSDTDRNKVESYLALKYGVTLDQSTAQSYTASDGTEMWDKDLSGANTMNHDIAGIGRDDASTLGQVKSRSGNSDSIITIEAVGEGTNATPVFADIQNLEFLTWGNNNGTTNEVTTNLTADVLKRLGRIWQVQEVGELGTTTVQFDLSGLTVSGTMAADFTLIIDSDTDFTTGATTITADSYSSSTNLATFNAVDFETGNYFALGTEKNMLSVGIVNTDGAPISNPTVDFMDANFSFDSQIATGTLGTDDEKIRINNSTDNSVWTLSIAATSTTAVWTGASSTYDFNDPTADGEDGTDDDDDVGGQLTIDPDIATLTPSSECSETGITKGTESSFSEGVTDSITLAQSDSTADIDCFWDITDIDLSQTIPPGQLADSYQLDLTLSIVAS